MIDAFFKINDAQVRAMIMNVLHNIELVSGKSQDERETLMALEALVSDVLKDQQQNSFTAQNGKGPLTYRAIPVTNEK